MNQKQLIVFDWGVSSYFGWGVYGLNLMLNFALRRDLEAVSAAWFAPADIVLGPLESQLIRPLLNASTSLHVRRASATSTMEIPALVLQSLGSDLDLATPAMTPLYGDPTIGVVFSENATLSAEALERAKRYPLIVTGSRWGQQVLASHGIRHSTTILQGIDPSNFHPAPKRGVFKDKFVVFSGGKLEGRKGQDLVVLAFRAFAQRHKDAVLLTAWNSPWPRLAGSLAENKKLTPVYLVNDRYLDLWRWTRENGIPQDQVFHLDATAHFHLPHVLREADIALFPNRAEAGTNLVAMECMACGIPTILSANTGHLDLIQDENCFPLSLQQPLDGATRVGWGESDVEEILAALELAYQNRGDAAQRGLRGFLFISQFTWPAQIDKLSHALKPYMKSTSTPAAAIA
jgi:glycosyltransferase involved in cell wall biosynthesis